MKIKYHHKRYFTRGNEGAVPLGCLGGVIIDKGPCLHRPRRDKKRLKAARRQGVKD